MRKFFLLFILTFSVFINATLLQYIPDNFLSMVYVPDLGKFYSDLKSTEIGDAFLNNLGFESMLDSMIRSQAQAYDIDADKLYEIKEFLLLNGKDWFAIIMGPVKEYEKVKEYLKSSELLPDQISIGEETYKLHLDCLDENMVLYAGEGDIIGKLKRKEAHVPSWVKKAIEDPKVDLVTYSFEKDVLESHIKMYSKGNLIADEGVSKVFDKDLVREIKDLADVGRFPESEVENGEGFVLLNVKDGKSILDLLDVIGILDVLKNEKGFDENIIRNFGGKVFIGFEYSQAIADQIYGGENEESHNKLLIKGFVTFKEDPSKILKEKLESCENKGKYYYCEGTKVVIKGNKVFFSNPEDATLTSEHNKRFFQSKYEGKENIMLCFDFSKILNDLFGLDTNSYMLFKVWVENGEIKSYGELR